MVITESEAARQLKVSVKYLRECRHTGDGPEYVIIGKRMIRYRPEDIEEWGVDKDPVGSG
jgi:predicted HicB family RNase H-like nuclease